MTDLTELGDTGGAWTRSYVFTQGVYGFGGETVPYFSTTMTLREALRELNLAHQLPVDPGDPVRLDELMQRILDDERSAGPILDYLLRPGRIKFFNSLTVVLLPTSPNGRPLDSYGEPAPLPSGVDADDTRYDLTRAGGVLVQRLRSGDAGYLRWQPEAVRPVIIDGQHRFLALQQLATRQPQVLDADTTRLPILFVIPDPALGFVAPQGAPSSIIATARAIFTDINKNAVKVTRERQYLLDDGSVPAVGMRQLLTDGIGGDNGSKARDVPARIPLAAIDWTRPDRVQFDDTDTPVICTIQSLHRLVLEVLPKQPGDTDHEQWLSWIRSMEAEVSPSGAAWSQDAMTSRLRRAEEQEVPFDLTDGEVRAAATAFADTMGQVVALPLLRLEPYAAMLDGLRQGGLLEDQGELWLGQDARGRAAYTVRFGQHVLQDVAADVAARVKGEYPLAYQVVFQRAFVVAGRHVSAARRSLAARWELPDEDLTTVLLAWIAKFNDKVASTLGDSAFWRGTAVSASGNLDYVGTPMRGAAGLVLLLTTEDWDDLEPAPDGHGEILERLFSRVPDDAGDAYEDDGDENKGSDAGQPGETELALRMLDEDPYVSQGGPNAHAAAHRWASLLADIRRGPAPDEAAALRRMATRQYRDGLRRYARDVHQAATGEDPSAEALNEMVLALGARRLAGREPQATVPA